MATMLLSGQATYQVSEIRRHAHSAGLREISKWNISSILSGDRALVINTAAGWQLQPAGVSELASLGIVPGGTSNPHKATATAQLRQYALKMTDPHRRSYVEEAITCYDAGLLRAAVVLSWVGAMAVLHDAVIKGPLVAFNTEVAKLDPKWKPASSADHLGLLKEDTFLDIIASPSVGLLGKNVKEELKTMCLKLRNGCGHPNSLKIGESRVAAHIESLVLNVFSQFP
jgi:hypothetical protein